MGLRIFNTLSRRLEPFEPGDPRRVGVYGCGPTLYGPAHIGNFRTFLFYDLVHRYLEWRGFGVHFVMNFTDVDDKTISAASEKGLTIRAYTDTYLPLILEEADTLGMLRFDAYPRATEHVDGMIDLVERLLSRGLAYSTEDGSVFFDISAFPEYGKLSGRNLAEARTGERVAEDDYGKKDVRDFALWKGVKEIDERVGAVWEAPWGRGRPGWHLECSVMALAEVAETVDLHLGGEDLIFPHHEGEIAQSEGATGKPFSRYWMHAKHLKVEGQKMSKSAGNFLNVHDLLREGFSPAAIRHQLLSAQYRTELNFTRSGLAASARAVDRLLDFEERLLSHPADPEAPTTEIPVLAKGAVEEFTSAMDADLNVAGGIGALFSFLNQTNAALDVTLTLKEAERDEAVRALQSLDSVLGFLEVGRAGRKVDSELRDWIEARIGARDRARAERNWDTADSIREELASKGILLEDGPDGSRWKIERASVDTSDGSG